MSKYDPQNFILAPAQPLVLKDSLGNRTKIILAERAANSSEIALTLAGATGQGATLAGTEELSNKTLTTLTVPKTIASTAGDKTVNQPAGSVIFANGTAITVTNSLVTANSVILLTVGTVDATMKVASAVAGSGSFLITPGAAPTGGAVRVNFLVVN